MRLCGWQIREGVAQDTLEPGILRRGVGEIVGGCLAGRQSSRLASDNYFPNFPFLSQFDLPSAFFLSLFFLNHSSNFRIERDKNFKVRVCLFLSCAIYI